LHRYKLSKKFLQILCSNFHQYNITTKSRDIRLLNKWKYYWLNLEKICSITHFVLRVHPLGLTHAGSRSRHSSIALSITIVPWRAIRLVDNAYFFQIYGSNSPSLNPSGRLVCSIIQQRVYQPAACSRCRPAWLWREFCWTHHAIFANFWSSVFTELQKLFKVWRKLLHEISFKCHSLY